MPELPEVRTVAKALKEKIIGKKITNYQIRYQNIIEDGSLSFDNLINKTILDITTYGKYLIFKIDFVAASPKDNTTFGFIISSCLNKYFLQFSLHLFKYFLSFG